MSLWWLELEPSVKASTITASATLLAALFGFGAVTLQIRRQGKNALLSNRQSEALKRKLAIYESTLETTGAAERAVADILAFVQSFLSRVSVARALMSHDFKMSAPDATYSDYLALRNEATTAIIGIISLVESWLIVDARLRVFSDAISMGLDEFWTASVSEDEPYLQYFSFPGREGEWSPPDENGMRKLTTRVERDTFHFNRFNAWISDFKVEMQMLLLSELFPNPIRRRDPPDPAQFCLRLDRYQEIADYIEKSAWGQKRALHEAEAWAKFASENTGD